MRFVPVKFISILFAGKSYKIMAPRKKRTTNNRNSLQDKKNVIIADFKKQGEGSVNF